MTTPPRPASPRLTVVEPGRLAGASTGFRRVFVRDLVLPCSIGIYAHEKHASQRVRMNLDLCVRERAQPVNDDIANVLNYETVIEGVRALVDSGHVNLVETLADSIAALCLAQPEVCSVRVCIEKLDILPNATSVGVEIERFNPQS